MQRLQRRSDGYCETPDGLFAISPKYRRVVGASAWFEFKVHALASTIRVEWPAEDDIILIDADIATVMVANQWAHNLDMAEVDAWNDAVSRMTAPSEEPAISAPVAEVVLAPPGEEDGAEMESAADHEPEKPRSGRPRGSGKKTD